MTRKSFLTLIILLFFLLQAGSWVSYAVTKEAKNLFLMGTKSMKNRQFDKAASYFSKALDESPDYKEAWYELGNTYFATGKYNKAMDNYYVALEIDPTYNKALKKIGSCFLKQNNFQMTAFKMEQAKEHYPNDPDIHFLLGQAYEGLKQRQKAMTSYSKARELQSEKYGFLNEKIDRLKESLAANTKSDDPSPTPMLTGPPLPEELPDPASTVLPLKTPDNIEGNVAVVPDKQPSSPAVSPEASPDKPDNAGPGLIKGTDISPEALDETYDETSDVGDKRKQILGVIRIGSIITVLLLLLTGGLHLLRERIKSQKRKVVLDRLELSRTAVVSGDSPVNAGKDASSHSNLFRERWAKHEEPEKEAVMNGHESGDITISMPAGTEPEKELEPAQQETMLLSKTKENSINTPTEDSESENKNFANTGREIPEPEHPYYRDVITGEKVRRKDSSRRLLTRMRARLRIDDLPGKNKELQPSENPEINNRIGYSKEISGDITSSSSDLPQESGSETEGDKKNSESPLKIRPLPDARSMKKRVDPFVCVCGKIVRDGAYICPRCGRGTR